MAGARGPVRFKQTEISRFARAVLASGMRARIELALDGKLSAIPLNAEPDQPEPTAAKDAGDVCAQRLR
jgi:hypothetical protein